MVIDKLVLAILKSYGKKVALEWLEEHREELKVMSCCSEEMQEKIKEKIEIVFLEFLNVNMYNSCYDKIILLGNEIEKIRLYY